MCGLFGFFTDSPKALSTVLLDACRDKLQHRGPDMAGNFQDRGLYLGFRRLSIIDLSPDGSQPMTCSDGRYTIVFNGEIYNFVELRTELERQGEVFVGHSDTEVLLRLFATSGVQCLARLNGMFAICVYDKLERTLLLVRDRLGVKPLFYWRSGRTFTFASEVRALRGLPGFPTAIDPEALGLYFRIGAVPEWAAIYPGLAKLAPGNWLRYHCDSGRIEGPVAYWDLPPVGEEAGKSEDEWIDQIEAMLWDATRIRLRSDVPLGVFLSGGIDSGLVAAAAAQFRPGLTSLTIGFGGESVDETALALATARMLKLNAVTRGIDLCEGLEALPSIMGHFDEPFSDTSALPTSLVCAEARKDFTVVLSGDAGDEVFGGYENHVRAWRWRAVDWVPLRWRREIGSVLASLSPLDSVSRRFFKRLRRPVGRFGLGGKLYPYQDWLDNCLKPELNLDADRVALLYDSHLPKWDSASSVDQAQRTDLRSYLLEDILIKVDRMSMMHSLEVRSPFLDYRMVELGLTVPSSLRTKNGCNKYLLRRLATRHLPDAVCRAPKKGFGIPVRSWLYSKQNVDELMRSLATIPCGHLDPFIEGGAERLWSLGVSNPALSAAILQVLCYRWWCQYQ